MPGPVWAAEKDIRASERPHLKMMRTAVAPTIDGRLDDTVWENAPAFRGLKQIEPIEGAPASEETYSTLQ